MEKPTKQCMELWNYRQCEEYIGYKLGINLDDVENKWNRIGTTVTTAQQVDEKFPDGVPNNKKPYHCFWHLIIDSCDIHNGCIFYMPSAKEDWQKPIINAFLEEFGDGPYWVAW